MSTLVKMLIFHYKKDEQINNDYNSIADFNGDGSVNVIDIVQILSLNLD